MISIDPLIENKNKNQLPEKANSWAAIVEMATPSAAQVQWGFCEEWSAAQVPRPHRHHALGAAFGSSLNMFYVKLIQVTPVLHVALCQGLTPHKSNHKKLRLDAAATTGWWAAPSRTQLFLYHLGLVKYCFFSPWITEYWHGVFLFRTPFSPAGACKSHIWWLHN